MRGCIRVGGGCNTCPLCPHLWKEKGFGLNRAANVKWKVLEKLAVPLNVRLNGVPFAAKSAFFLATLSLPRPPPHLPASTLETSE